MELSNIYTGMKVKVIGFEGTWEIEKIEEYTKSVHCKRTDINIHDMREIKLENIQRL